jgi:hypothetical protein
MRGRGFSIFMFWPKSPESVAHAAKEVAAFLKRLGELDPAWTGWSVLDADGNPAPCADEEDFVGAVAATREEWSLGGRHGEWYEQSFFNPADKRVKCSVVVAFQVGGDGVWLQNRIRLDVPEARRPREHAEALLMEVLRCGAEILRPRYGFVATTTGGGGPFPDWEPMNMGAATVGWMTYLDAGLGAVPSLPAPTRVVPVADLGSIIVACPLPWQALSSEQRALLSDVRKALEAAGVRRPNVSPDDEENG